MLHHVVKFIWDGSVDDEKVKDNLEDDGMWPNIFIHLVVGRLLVFLQFLGDSLAIGFKKFSEQVDDNRKICRCRILWTRISNMDALREVCVLTGLRQRRRVSFFGLSFEHSSNKCVGCSFLFIFYFFFFLFGSSTTSLLNKI